MPAIPSFPSTCFAASRWVYFPLPTDVKDQEAPRTQSGGPNRSTTWQCCPATTRRFRWMPGRPTQREPAPGPVIVHPACVLNRGHGQARPGAYRQVARGDAVFIFARGTQSPRKPLVIAYKQGQGTSVCDSRKLTRASLKYANIKFTRLPGFWNRNPR